MKKTVPLDDMEVQLLRTIVLDRNKDDALEFLTDIIWDRIDKDRSRERKPTKET
jgi:hypothetical protein